MACEFQSDVARAHMALAQGLRAQDNLPVPPDAGTNLGHYEIVALIGACPAFG
jgi:hypothetical protein